MILSTRFRARGPGLAIGLLLAAQATCAVAGEAFAAPPLPASRMESTDAFDPSALTSARPVAPPWGDPSDIPIPPWARSVLTTRSDAPIFAWPGEKARRGSALLGARLPLFATKLAPGCASRWFNVGPLAWICSDVAEYTRDDPSSPPLGASEAWSPWVPSVAQAAPVVGPVTPKDDGLPYRYYFVVAEHTYAYANLDDARDDIPEQDLDRGFGLAVVEEKTFEGQRWARTKAGRWVAVRDLAQPRSSRFYGSQVVEGRLDFGWILPEKARVFDSEKATKVTSTKARFDRVTIVEERAGKGGTFLGITGDGDAVSWVRASDVARPSKATPPEELGGEAAPPQVRWIDVELATQTLVAYEGSTPVFATLVSTGKGAPGSPTATNPGVHRIWVKLFTTTMDNLDEEDPEHRYAIEDVPFVQFFDKGIALHAAFWHRNFGRVHSHGCVNLAPLDARWLFAFTAPHLPRGWTAVHPSNLDPSTVVRVR